MAFVVICILGIVPVIGLLLSIAFLGTIPASLSVGCRRLHDMGYSGWWQLLMIIPLAGMIILLIWSAMPGNTEANQYGPPVTPRPPASIP